MLTHQPDRPQSAQGPLSPVDALKSWQARYLRIMIFVVMGTMFAYSLIWLGFKVYLASLVCGFCLALSVALHFAYKNGLSPNRTAIALMWIASLGVFSLNALVWNELPLMAAYFVFSPILATILISHEAGLRWGMISTTLALLSIFLANELGHPEIEALVRISIDYNMNVFQVVTLIFLGFVFSKMLSNAHQGVVDALSEQQNQLREKNIELAKIQKYKDHFFATMSHELRTPMTAIVGVAELLKNPSTDPHEHAELTKSLSNSSHHLLAIINDLLDLSKLQENRLKIVFADFNLRETLYNAYNMLKSLALEKKINYTFETGADLPKMVTGDSHRLTQILVNLLSNAVKFTHSGRVAFSAHCREHLAGRCLLIFKVSDTGIGIDPSQQDNLFKEFTQAHEGISATYGGTGLGLSIAKRLAELQGGKLEFSSQMGVGTIFTLEIELATPMAVNDPTHLPGDTSGDHTGAAHRRGEGMRILVVDDNMVNLLIAKKQLQKIYDGIEVDTAEDGLDAVAKIEGADYNLVLMDLLMPRMNGIEATSAIRALSDAHRASTPIVAMTANVGQTEFEACLQAGMNDVLGKPYVASTLSVSVEKNARMKIRATH